MSAQKTKSGSNKTIITILAVCVIIGLILSVGLFLSDAEPATATASIQFSFRNAADGIAPNGNRYGIDDITSDEVLNATLVDAGMADKYTAEDIRGSLNVTGVYPEDLVKQMTSYDSLLDFTTNREFSMKKFNPTQFSIILTNEFDSGIGEADLEKLLASLLKTYKAAFIAKYSVNFDATEYDQLYSLSGYDYPQMLEITELEMNQVARYADELYEMDPTFTWQGVGFNDIYIRMQNLVDNDIVRMNANLTMNALTKDPQRLLMQYECEIRDLNNELEKKNAELASLDKLLEAYDKNEIIYLSTSDSLTKIDGNSSETYDKLVEKRKEISDEITAIKTEIKNYQLKIKDLTATAEAASIVDVTSNTDSIADAAPAYTANTVFTEDADEKVAQIQVLEAEIEVLLGKKDAIVNDFMGMLKAYNGAQLNDSTVSTTKVKTHSSSLISGAFVKKGIKTAGPVVVIGLLICLVLIIRKQKIG